MQHTYMTIASIIKKFDEINNSQYKPNGQALYRFLLNKGLTPRKKYINGAEVSMFDGRNAVNMMTRFIGELKQIDAEVTGRVKAKEEEKIQRQNNKPTSPELELDGVKLFNENKRNMKKKIKLTESVISNLISESINRVLNESEMDYYGDEISKYSEKMKMAALSGNVSETKIYANKIIEFAQNIESFLESNMGF